MGKNTQYIDRDGFRFRLKCGDYGCSRDGTQVPVGLVIKEFDDYPGTTPAEREEARREQAYRALRCNIHVGAAKRSSWRREEYEPLANRADVRALAEARTLELLKAKAVADNRAMVERQRKAVERYNEEWADYLRNRDFEVVEVKEDKYWGNDEWFKVQPVDGGRGWSDTYEVKCEASARADNLPSPRQVRVTSTGSFTPKQARAIAKALIMMANRVENENLMIAPVNDKGEQVVKEA